MSDVIDTFHFEHSGRAFVARIVTDDSSDAPWENSDGHGVVSDWETRNKRPGERILSQDRYSKRFYDWQESISIARRDGWGVSDEVKRQFFLANGRNPTPGELTVLAVEQDFKFLRGWCDGDWGYVGVCVAESDDDDELDYSYALWGIESCAESYLQDVARELADDLIHDNPNADTSKSVRGVSIP